MAGFSQGAIELKKKNLLSAAPNDFIKLSINTDNIPYTVDENGVYRYLNYYDNAGISSYPLSDLIDNGDGTCSILSATARVYSTNNFTGTLLEYSIPSATFTLTDGTEQYICIKYNSGTPIFYVENDKNQINESNVICVYCCWRQGNEIHSIGTDSKALGLPNKISLSITDTIPYRKSVDGGLVLSESITPNQRTILITSANVYAGVIRNNILEFNSSIDRLTLAYHNSGNWLYQDDLIYNNSEYDDGINLQTIGNNKYSVRWFYRSIGDIKQTFYVLGNNQYNSISDARLEMPRNDLPIVLRKHCILIARIIIQYNASSGLVENVSDITFSTTSIQNHNDLANIQGGSVGNYYHVSANTFSYLSAVSADIQQQLNSKVSSAGSPTNHNNLLNLQGGSSGNYYHVSASTFGYLSAVSADIQQQLNSKISSAAAPTNHNNLLGLQGGSSGNYYHVSASTFGYLSAVSANIQQQLDSKVPRELLNILQEPTGFIDRNNTRLLFNDSTRTFTISALTSSFDVYYRGNKFTKTTESIVIPNISGLHFIYYSSAGVLSQLNNTAWDILTTIQIAVVYWTGTSSLGLTEERHGTVMDCATHSYLHNTLGTRYESGFNSTYTLSNDSSAYFGVSNGIISDEDLRISISQGSSGNYFTQQINYPGYFPVFYRSGSDGLGTWRKDPAIIFPYKNLGAGTRVTFNELSGTVWKQTETNNNNFVAYYIYATDEIYQPVIAVQGQRQDTSLIDAKNNNVPGTLSFTDFPIVEAKLLYRIIVKTNASYTGNPFYARIEDVTDYRNQLVSTGSIVGGTGTVTYVGLSANPIFTIAGTPITNAGTFTIDLSAQSSGTFLGGPISGNSITPSFRRLTSSDIPPISNFYLPLSGGTLYGQMRGTSVSASGNISAANFSVPGSVIFQNSNAMFGSLAGTSADIFIRNTSANGTIIDYPFVIEKTGLNRITLGYSGIVRPIRMGGPVTILNLSVNGFVRSDSSGLLTSSPLTSSDIPPISNLYLPLSGGTLTGQLNAQYISADGGFLVRLDSPNINQIYRPTSSVTTTFGQTFEANNSIGQKVIYSRIQNSIDSSISGLQTGSIYFRIYKNGIEQTPIQILDDQLKIFGIVSASGNIYTNGFVKIGGSPSQFLKADGTVDSNSYALNSSLGNYLPLSGGTLTGQLKGTSVSASGNISATDTFFNSLKLSNAELTTYNFGNINPTKRLYQVVGNTDYWSIYGEGADNSGSMILEVGDDISETIKFRYKNTNPPYTTYTPYEFNYNQFNMSSCRQRIYYDALIDSNLDYAENALEISTNTESPSHSFKPGIGFHSRGQYASLLYLNAQKDWKAKDDSGTIITFYHTANLPSVLGNYLPLSGGTMAGDISFVNSTTGIGKGIYGTNGDNDHWRIIGGSTGTNSGYLEIATDDDKTEPIYIRQYQGTFSSPTSIRTLTLLDQNGDTNFPGNISANNIINRGSYYVSNYAAGGNPSLITNQGVATFYTLNLDFDGLTSERSLKFADCVYLGPTFSTFFNNGSSQNNAIVIKGAGNQDYAGIYFGNPGINPRYIGTRGDNILYLAGTNINLTGVLTQNGNSTFVGNTNIGRIAWPNEYSMTIYDKFYLSGTAILSNLKINGNSEFNGNIIQNEGDTFLGQLINIDDHTLYNYNYSQIYGTSEFNNNVIFNDPVTLNSTSQFNTSANFAALTRFTIGQVLEPTLVNVTSYIVNDLAAGFIVFSNASTTATNIILSDSVRDGKTIYILNYSGGSRTIVSNVTEGLQLTPTNIATSVSIPDGSLYICIKYSSGAYSGGWKVREL